MAASAYTDTVQKVYIAYYGRAADPVGLAYWSKAIDDAGGSLDAIMTSFGTSAEATTLYGSLSNSAKVNAIYQQSFGRDADFTGLMYYSGQLSAGTMTASSIAQNIFDGATGTDATTLTNKLAVAKAYTTAIDTASEVVAYAGTVAAASARTLLSTVDSTTTTSGFDVATSIAGIVSTANATAVVAGKTFALTSGADSFTTTSATAANVTSAGDDVFRGTLDSTDIIKAGAGNDSITATVADGQAAVTIAPLVDSVETINLSVTDGHADDLLVTLNLAEVTGASAINLTMAADVTTKLSGVASETVTLKTGGATSDSTVAYTGLSTATDGGADAKTINASTLDLVTLTVAGVEMLTLNASGTAGDVDFLIADALESLVITGGVVDADSTTETFAIGTTSATAADKAIEFDGLSAAEITAGDIGSIDASTSTGAITLVVDDSFDFTATGGAGKMTIANTSAGSGAVTGTAAVTIISGTGGIAATLEGGSNTSSATAMTLVSVTGSAAKDTVDLSLIVNPTNITATTAVNEAQTTNVTVTTGAAADAITIKDGVVNLDAGAGDDTLTVTTWGSIDKYDTIDMGAGSDTIVTSEATLGASQAAVMAYYTNAEVIDSSSTAEKAINMVTLGTATSAVLSGAHSATAQLGVAAETGTAALTFTSSNANATVTMGALAGQVGGKDADATAGIGGAAIDANASLDNGSNTMTVYLTDDADIIGGAGGQATAANNHGGVGGMGIDANEFEVLNLVLSATDTVKDVVVINGGAGGAKHGTGTAGVDGVAVTVGANATINITETLAATSGTTALTIASHISSINLGNIVGNNVNVQAGTINGAVTIESVAGNSTINTGAGADVITAGSGIDTIDTGAGNDIVNAQAGADVVTLGAGINTVTVDEIESTEAATDTYAGFNLATASWTGSSATDAVTEYVSTGVGGATGDIIDVDVTATIHADVAAGTASANSTANVTYAVVDGILTLAGTGAAAIDTLAEWIDEAEDVLATEDEFLAFVFDGNTYVSGDMGSAADTVIQLTGVSATGFSVLAGSGTIGGDGFIIIG